MTSERAVLRETDVLAEAVTGEIVEAYTLNRDHRRSRWHDETPDKTYRESWACVPLTDAVYAVMAAAHSALRLAAARGEPETLSRAEYARLKGIEDIARLIVSGWDSGFPVSDGSGERELIDRLAAALATPTTPEPDPER